MKRAADLFCGAGGLSIGVEMSKKVSVVLAVNHWRRAIETHSVNMPHTKHFCQDVDSVSPSEMTKLGVNVLLASPECTNHCVAKGGRPYNEQSRSSAWHVLKFADAVHPDHIIVENVHEFMDWGPLFEERSLRDTSIDWDKEGGEDAKKKLAAEIDDWEKHRDLFGFNAEILKTKIYSMFGRPIKQMKGRIFNAWVESLRAMGYTVDYKLLNAADYGAATTRTRLFIVAGKQNEIRWPEQRVQEKDWKPVKDIIDWELPCPSIFERKTDLAPATLKRIEAGIRKFWGDGFEPFIVTMYGASKAHSVDNPLGTITTGNKHALVQPFLIKYHGGKARVHGIDEPLRTIDTSNRFGLVQPFLVSVNHGGEHKHRAHDIEKPIGVITTSNGFAVVQPFLIKLYGTGKAVSVDRPLDTVTAGGNKFGLVKPFLVSYYGNGSAFSVDEPIRTITTKDRFALAQPELKLSDGLYYLDIGLRMLTPAELAAAMGFPATYKIMGTKADQVKQIGNAVCPPVAQAIAEAMLRN